MVDYQKLLRESKDLKFETIASKKEIKDNSHSCNYSPKSKHKYCTHSHCIFDKEWQEQDKQKTILQNQIKMEEDFLKNGQGCYGYDFKKVYKNVLKLKKKLHGRK